MIKQPHRICVRMSAETYDLLRRKSRKAGLSMNGWLMRELNGKRPIVYRELDTTEVVHFMNEAGKEINAIAKDFNSGYGTAAQLRYAVRKMSVVVTTVSALRKKGYAYAD